MEKTNKSLKEWNAIVEALGQGKQTILIRKYYTTLPGFLLYPTFSYALRDDYLDNFKEEYKQFVKENTLPKKEGDKTEIKFYAKVEKITRKSSAQIYGLNKYHIWHNNHVREYLKGKNGFIWILKVFKVENPYMAEIIRSIKYANLKKEIDLSNAKPVLDNKHFSEISKGI
jgi:restriction system protein